MAILLRIMLASLLVQSTFDLCKHVYFGAAEMTKLLSISIALEAIAFWCYLYFFLLPHLPGAMLGRFKDLGPESLGDLSTHLTVAISSLELPLQAVQHALPAFSYVPLPVCDGKWLF